VPHLRVAGHSGYVGLTAPQKLPVAEQRPNPPNCANFARRDVRAESPEQAGAAAALEHKLVDAEKKSDALQDEVDEHEEEIKEVGSDPPRFRALSRARLFFSLPPGVSPGASSASLAVAARG